MTFPRELFAFAMILVFRCKADYPPSRLSYQWLDPFTVNVSWDMPSRQLDNSEVKYMYCLVKNGTDDLPRLTVWRNFTENLLTEEKNVNHWTYNIWTVSNPSNNCNNGSTRVPLVIESPKPQAEVVKDFKCFISPYKTNCSWTPVKPSLKMRLSYRTCGYTEESLKGLKACEQFYSNGMRVGCHLQIDYAKNDICIHVDSEAGMSTFKATLVVPPPPMKIREEGDFLNLSWKHPGVGLGCFWRYKVCYKKCNNQEECQDFPIKGINPTGKLPYDRTCLYQLRSSVSTDQYCKFLFSDFGDDMTYGTNKLPDGTPTVVAIVIPVILSVCVLLSCYCFRRHRAIICPIIPDPSAIFKEMMMNGNKELKATTGSLYAPMPEPVEPCKIALVTDDGILQQNC